MPLFFSAARFRGMMSRRSTFSMSDRWVSISMSEQARKEEGIRWKLVESRDIINCLSNMPSAVKVESFTLWGWCRRFLVVVLEIIFSIQNQSGQDITVTLSDLSPCPISGKRHTYSEKCWVLAHNEHVQIDWPPSSLSLSLSLGMAVKYISDSPRRIFSVQISGNILVRVRRPTVSRALPLPADDFDSQPERI